MFCDIWGGPSLFRVQKYRIYVEKIGSILDVMKLYTSDELNFDLL